MKNGAKNPNIGISAVFACAFLAASCGGGEPGVVGSPDSNPVVAELRLELVLGERATAPPEYQFASILSMAAAPDGTLWVLDGANVGLEGQTPLLRQFDSLGTFLRQVGREGSGPGEYRAPYEIWLMRDGRVALRDYALPGRITFYQPDGTVDSTWSLGLELMWPFRGGYPIQFDTSGVLWLPFMSGRPRPERPPPVYLRVRPDGSVLDTVAMPDLPEVDADHLRITRRLPSGGTSVRGFTVPYQPKAVFAWSPVGQFLRARTDQYRVEMLPPPTRSPLQSEAFDTAANASIEVLWRDASPVPVPEGEREAGRERLIDQVSRVEGAEDLRIPDIPTHKPLLRGLGLSQDGRLIVWVSMPSVLKDGEWVEPRAFDLFNTDSRLTGRIVLPDALSLIFLSGDRLWGVHRDHNDVESIRRYTIVWPGGGLDGDGR